PPLPAARPHRVRRRPSRRRSWTRAPRSEESHEEDRMPLEHRGADKKDDATLQQEARAHLIENPGLQLVAELLTKLHRRRVPWWTSEQERGWWTATDRMRWFNQRQDIRQRITTALSGLAPKQARKKGADFQASLIDGAVDDGDVSARQFEEAFDPAEI